MLETLQLIFYALAILSALLGILTFALSRLTLNTKKPYEVKDSPYTKLQYYKKRAVDPFISTRKRTYAKEQVKKLS